MMGGGGPVGLIYAPDSALPEGMSPAMVTMVVDIAEEQLPALRREIGSMPGVFALEISVFTRLIEGLLGTFMAFPTMVAAVGLVVGGVVSIADLKVGDEVLSYDFASGRQTTNTVTLVMSRDVTTAPLFLRPSGRNHPRQIFAPEDPVVEVLRQWAQK